MPQQDQIEQRKLEHIKIVQEEKVEPVESPFKNYRLPYKALPEINLKEISTNVRFFEKDISFPFLISSMTGGPAKASVINKNLAIACEQEKVALALGSMRVLLKDPIAANSFKVREFCPSIPLFANMGLVQLNYGYGADEINKLIDIIDADGIFLHINHMQESIQPGGDTNFKDLLKKLAEILPQIKKPVLIKEVGSGMDKASAQALFDIGVKWIDVSGLGGTSWTSVEAHRRTDDLGFLFEEVGIKTDKALQECREIKGLNLIAGGGIRSGLDVAKSLMMGAKIATAAKPFLEPALTSSAEVSKLLQRWKEELTISMFACGVKDVDKLSGLKLLVEH